MQTVFEGRCIGANDFFALAVAALVGYGVILGLLFFALCLLLLVRRARQRSRCTAFPLHAGLGVWFVSIAKDVEEDAAVFVLEALVVFEFCF